MRAREPVPSLHRSRPSTREPGPELAASARVGADETARGAIFTRPEVARALLDLAGYASDALPSLHHRRLLEPSFGGGDVLLVAVERLLAAFSDDGGMPDEVTPIADAICGVEIDADSFERTRELLRARLRAWGATARAATGLCDAWLVRGDFLLAPLRGRFDAVVGNPPYVRQERIAGPLLAEYRRRYATIYDRADLYVPFFERGLQLLAEGGRLAFICADRWMKNRYGGPLRGLIARDHHLSHHVAMDGAAAFHAAVLSYPAITVIRRGAGQVTRVARGVDALAGLPTLVRALTAAGPPDDPRVEELTDVVRGSEPWLFDADDRLQVLRRLERALPSLEMVGCKVGIGVATGADRVFIAELAALPVEPSRKLPLVMAGDLQGGALVWGGRGVVDPFEADGTLASLDRYPALGAYLRAHEAVLRARHVARRGPGWYRTIDRIDAALTATPKLLIPDIKGEPTVVYDPGEFYPHHNLYHVTSQTWDLRALATVLRSSIARLFVASYCVKMSGGFLRFQAQYLRRIRVPRWEAVTPAQRAALLAASPDDRAQIDAATFAIYGLSPAEARTMGAR